MFPVLTNCLLEKHCHSVKKFPALYGTEGLLQCSQESATGTCPDLDASSPHLPILFL